MSARDLNIIIKNRNAQLESVTRRLEALQRGAQHVVNVLGEDDSIFEFPCITKLRAALRESRGE